MNAATPGVRQLSIATREIPKAASAASPGPRPTATVKAATNGPSTPTNPASSPRSKIDEFVGQYRAFGSEIWPERRRLFQRLFAAAHVAQEIHENPKDSELYAELLKLGQRFGLFDCARSNTRPV